MTQQALSARQKIAALGAALCIALSGGAAAQGQRDIAAPDNEARPAANAAGADNAAFPPAPPGAASGAAFPPPAAEDNAAPPPLRSAPLEPAAATAPAAAAVTGQAAGQDAPAPLSGPVPPLSPAGQSLALHALQQQIEALRNRVTELEAAQQKMQADIGRPAASAPPPALKKALADDEAYTVPADIGADALYQSGQDFMAQGRYAKAALVWRAFGARFPDDERAAAADFELGESYYARGLYAKAAEAYLDVQAKYKTAPVAPRSLLQLALSMAELQDRQTACAALEQLSRQYPQADPALIRQGAETGRHLQCP